MRHSGRSPIRSFLFGIASGALATASLVVTCASAQERGPAGDGMKVVLELYTSQGCSSCPPADALLPSYIERPDVVALSVPVDYWDRLGWKDTFGSPEHSERQRRQAVARGDGQVYTPQMVVNGVAHAVGSSRGGIDQAIAAARRSLADKAVTVRAHLDGGDLVIETGAARPDTPVTGARLLVAAVQSSGTVAIRNGENGGHSVTYHNVMRSLRRVATWNGKAETVRVPLTSFAATGEDRVAVLLQSGEGGPILGAVQIELPAPRS